MPLIATFRSIFQTLEDKDRKTSSSRENLLREQRYLRRRLELLTSQMDASHKRRSLSESSSGSSVRSSNSESGRTQLLIGFAYFYKKKTVLSKDGKLGI